jgi:hypothetical protein
MITPETSPLLMLGHLAGIAAREDVEPKVTLLVGGAWVSGHLTSLRRYLDASAAELDRILLDTDEKLGDSLASAFTAVAGAVAAVDKPPEDAREIYLRDATVGLGDRQISNTVVAIRADQVDAILLGTVRNKPQ